MSNASVSIEEARRHALALLDGRSAELDRREEEARRMLAECSELRAEIEAQRSALDQADRLFREALSGSYSMASTIRRPPQGDVDYQVPVPSRPIKRARIGPQRYRMFHALREHPTPLTALDIAMATDLDVRRVRDQMASDALIGMVIEDGSGFQLTPAGLDLLTRFEAYKRSKGQVLPPLDGPLSEEDANEADPPETQAEGDQG